MKIPVIWMTVINRAESVALVMSLLCFKI